MNLTEVANKNKTDKGTQWFEKHSYTEVYQKYINYTSQFKLLEIGVYHGDSIRMWKEYNSKIDLYVMDNNPSCLSLFDNSLCKKIFIGDQGNKDDLLKIKEELGENSLDYVVDDGSHEMSDHHISLASILPLLKSGGIYFIEDLHTCSLYEEKARTDAILKNFLKTKKFFSPFLLPEENSYISENILDIEFFNGDKLVKIVKK